MKRARRKKQFSTNYNKKNKKTNKKLKIFVSVFVCLIIAVVIALGLGEGNNALIPIDTSTGKMNVLFLGVDKEGLRTDAIMVASYDFDEESLKLLSVPRDTKVFVTNRKVTRKINEVHAMTKKNGEIMGPLASVEAVSAITGIPINYYVEFSFDAIDHIMDILGPVTFDVPDIEGGGKGMNYDDPTQDLHIHLKPGLQNLSGNQVQQFLRYRKSNSGTVDGSDISRVGRQQEFVKAILDQKVNLSLIVKAPNIYSQVKKEIKTNFSSNEIAKYATHLLNLSSENITSYSLPGEDKHTSAWYFECDLDATRTLIENEFGYDASNITNKMEITGEKYSAAKTSKNSDNTKNSENTNKIQESSTKKPSETIKSETEKPTQTPAQSTADPTEEPKQNKTEQNPEKTQAPKNTEEPPRSTVKPTQSPSIDEDEDDDEDDDVIVIED